MDEAKFYDLVVKEAEKLSRRNVSADYRACKALAACYELQDYLANRLAEADGSKSEIRRKA